MGAERNNMEITYDPKNLKVVPIDDVRPNTWNPKEKNHDNVKKIETNIKRIGFNEPIRVRENEGFEIIDGEQRWTAAKNLGLKEVLIYNEGVMTEPEARASTLWWQVQIPFDDIKLAYEVANLSLEMIELPYSEVEIEAFKELANFSFDDYDKDQNDEPEEGDDKTLVLKLTGEGYNVIMNAISKIQDIKGDMSNEIALERICSEYIGAE